MNVTPFFIFTMAVHAIGQELIPDNSSQCLPSLPLFKDQPGKTETVGKGVQAIFSSLVITCTGHITSWRAYTKDKRENTIYFQIWRPDSNDKQLYSLVGENVLPNAKPSDTGIVSLIVDETESIKVLAGDVIGIYQADRKGGFGIKMKQDRQSKMFHYKRTVAPSVGTYLKLVDHKKDELLASKEQIPLVTVTIEGNSIQIDSTSVSASSSSYVSSSTVSNAMPQSTNSPSSTNTNPTTPGNSNNENIAQSNSVHVSTDDMDSSCDSGKSMFLVMVVLVMAIAILLLVVFILGTALVLVSLKLRHTKDSKATGASKHSYVGKQIVVIEGRHTQNRSTKDSGIPPTENIENPSYIIDKKTTNSNGNANSNFYNRRNERRQNSDIIPDNTEQRLRTDSYTTVITREIDAQEYEKPQNYSIPQTANILPRATGGGAANYSFPRSIPAGQRLCSGVHPLECSIVNHTEIPIQPALQTEPKRNKHRIEHV